MCAWKTLFVGDAKRKIVPSLLYLGLRCCLSNPESRPSMRVVKQVFLQLQGKISGNMMVMLNLLPPLPSTMLVYGSAPQVPNLTFKVTSNLSLRDGGVFFILRSDTMSVLRRRFQSG
ncbi:hypothetical protein KC19_2G283800 [Ceratodon purpureus]|uniref:Uncharacterized protein n=1 Tax=Ceratodon purpureus TaxID=3225 RepID=A0A8T0IZ51_CERPU|nr:hypothetical protein KC19_2G283800 [Ceratodon purpureus]